MPTTKTEVVVIGAGPAGYLAAIRAAQLGKRTVCVERASLGGVCLNVGCIPSKALITAAKTVEKIRDAAEMGITVSDVRIDMTKMQSWKESIVRKLTGGVAQLLKGNGISHLAGEARFVSDHAVEVQGTEAVLLEFEHCIIATGSRPAQIPGFAFDQSRVLDSTGALALTEVPKRLCVIGGGYIGLELGILYSKLGSKVTIVEVLDQLLFGTDPELVSLVERKLKKKGTTVHLRARARGFEETKDGLRVSVETQSGPVVVECDRVIVAVGRKPNTENLDLPKAGVKLDARGFIPVDVERRTNVPHIFAVGDITPGPMLAHKGYREGEVAAEVIAGQTSAFDVRCIPAVIFTDPEIAYAGVQEHEAKASGRAVMVGKFAFGANGRALTAGEPEGFVKAIIGTQEHELLGCAIVGPNASDLIAEATLAIEMGALVPDIAMTIHAHPTLPETFAEAVRAAIGEAVHSLPAKPRA